MTTYSILFLAAVIPPIYLAYLIYQLDKIEKEPVRMLMKLFIIGALISIPVIFAETWGENFLYSNIFTSAMSERDITLYYFLENFLVVALVEEGFKFLALFFTTWNSKEFNYRFDAVVYAVVISLGFACLENVLYVSSYGLSNAMFRAITAIPGHCIFGIYMGTFYDDAKEASLRDKHGKCIFYLFVSLLVPVVLHGFYDFCVSVEDEYMLIIFLVYIVLLDVIAIRNIKAIAREDELIRKKSYKSVSSSSFSSLADLNKNDDD